MAPATLNYQREEKVLCFHHEILYEAKITDLRHTDPDDRKSPYEYLVHYKGWKNTYVFFFHSFHRLLKLRDFVSQSTFTLSMSYYCERVFNLFIFLDSQLMTCSDSGACLYYL